MRLRTGALLAFGVLSGVRCTSFEAADPYAAGAPIVSCGDLVRNGAETDVDCGGSECTPCAEGQACLDGADCASGACPAGTCVPATCTDDVRNATETDVDCGGGVCPLCAAGKVCVANPHCESLVCAEGVCAAATCSDGVLNGGEKHVDCGGGCPCADGQSCDADIECASNICGALPDGGETICLPTSCNDGEKNGAETDIDCGGGGCLGCAALANCLEAKDCASLVCVNTKCQAPTCSDGVSNGTETGTDCGGGCAAKCPAGSGCQTDADCQSDVCKGGACVAAGCDDGVENGAETSIDCGGGCPCDTGAPCAAAADCESGVCVASVCQAPTCSDGVDNGAETSIDCGGVCPGCASGESCLQGGDCQSLVCAAGSCTASTCADGVMNGAESDVDCGGACADCGPGAGCWTDSDCAGGACITGTCAATCSDGVENQGESDVDCGGPMCPKCADGKACTTLSDCASNVCAGGTCQVATCSDGLKSGMETDVDCGGPTCTALCGTGKQCVFIEDCMSGACNAGLCGPWVKTFGTLFYERHVHLAARPDGALVVSGQRFYSVDFGGGPVPSNSIAVFSPFGELLETKSLYTCGYIASAVRVEPGGDVLLAGYGNGGCDFGGGLLPGFGAQDVFVARYTPAGAFVWAKIYGGTQSTGVADIALAPNGDVVLSGDYWGASAIDWGGGIVLPAPAGSAGFVARLSGADGTALWAKALGGDFGNGVAIAANAAGQAFLSGYGFPSVDLGGVCAPLNGANAFLAKLDTNGQCLWMKATAGGQLATAITADAAGDLLFTAAVHGNHPAWNLGGGDLQAGAGVPGFVFAKLAGAGGAHIWSRAAPNTILGLPSWFPVGIVADAGGNAVVTGSFNVPAADFGAGPLPYAGGSDIFVAAYSAADGSHLTSKSIGGPGDDFSTALVRSPLTGNIATAGGFEQTVDFGAGPVTALALPQVGLFTGAYLLSMGTVP